MEAILGMLAVSLIGSIISAAIQANTAYRNIESQEKINRENVQSQKDINAQNVEAQKEINQQNIAYSKEFAQNQIQWKMADLDAAGLNPTLAAGMGSGTSSPSVLSAPSQIAPKQQAPFLDMSGVSSAITAMSNMMMTSFILSQRNDIQQGRNDILSDKNDVLRNLYRRKAEFLDISRGQHVNTSKQISNVTKSKEWEEILKELDKMPYKYNYRP